MARRHGRSRPAARADAEARRGQRQPDEGRKPRPHLLQAAAAHERHGQNALQHLHSPHGGGNARAPRGADTVVRRGDHRAHDHLDRRLLRPQRKHRLLPVLGGQLDHRGLHVRLVGQFHTSVSGRYTALAGGPAQRRAARLLRHRPRSSRSILFSKRAGPSAPPSSTRPFRSQRSFPPPATAQRISTFGRSSAVLCCSL